MLENAPFTKILSRVAAEDFVGRNNELDALLQHAEAETDAKGLILLAAPQAGASELLRQTYDRLFQSQKDVIPVYFAFANGDKTARRTAIRFLQTFLLQTVAFRRGDARLLSIAPDVCEISELAAPSDAQWLQQLIKTCQVESELANESSFVRTALSAPLRAFASGARVFVMLDDLQRAENLTGETSSFEQLQEIYTRAEFSYVLAGKRRFILNAARAGNAGIKTARALRLGALANAEAERLIEKLADRNAVKINEPTRDLIIRQFHSNPALMTELFDAARDSKVDLDSFHKVQKTTIDAIFGGSFGKFYDCLFDEIAPNPKVQRQIIRLLRETAETESRKSSIDIWHARLKQPFEEVYRIIRRLHLHEIVRVNGGSVETATAEENSLLADYIEARYRLEISSEPRALVVSDVLTNALKRAPEMMSRHYRRAAAINVKELLANFNCQKMPASFFDYAVFKAIYKGAADAEILADSENETEKITLPQIVYTANASAFYPPLAHFTDTERAAVALGFEAGDYRAENEIVWIAAQIDSKLEAAQDLTEFWCDRLETVALACDFPHYRLWLITPEGFSAEALEVLKRRKVYGSSRKQVELLVAQLQAKNVFSEKKTAEEYEIVVPMGDDTEIIAARAVEEIARRHSFKPAAINQIKTAMVEAYINAAEHSLSPDRKIYQKLTVEGDKIVITIANRGVKMPAEKVLESVSRLEPSEGRRGWGLKLMRRLMDEVSFEQTDDGTRISMIKYLK